MGGQSIEMRAVALVGDLNLYLGLRASRILLFKAKIDQSTDFFLEFCLFYSKNRQNQL